MTLRLRFSAHALGQLEEALAYVAAHDPRAVESAANQIEQRLSDLRRFPASGRLVPELGGSDHREVIVAPYRIIYRVVGEEIRVLAVVHGRRMLDEALPDSE